MKRIVIATLFGLLAGVICATVAASGHLLKLTAVSLVWVLLNRTVMGFAIGTSALKLHWAWNGIIMGLVVGSIFSYYLSMTLGNWKMLLLIAIGNAVYGFLIELFTTVVFQAAGFSGITPDAACRSGVGRAKTCEHHCNPSRTGVEKTQLGVVRKGTFNSRSERAHGSDGVGRPLAEM